MFNSKFNFKTISRRAILAVALLGAIMFSGCEVLPDNPMEEAQPELAALDFLDRPVNPCGSSVILNLENPNGDQRGTVEFVNDDQYAYVIFSLDHGYVAENMLVYGGTLANFPVKSGAILYEAFPYVTAYSRPENSASFRINLNDLPSCATMSLRLKIAQVDMFGNTYGSDFAYLDGVDFADGDIEEFCISHCPVTPVTRN